ncbi:Calcium-transporting ATPase 1 (BACCA1) [Durusdinium trenchii]|uniref:Calcium-transporting ATPase 1 (BACCA1) n=1 Tax=Durusdinium trenchii TaxID=1381693 RepID=A0ABP0HFB6_9DINO
MKPDDAVSHVTLPPFKDLILKMSAEEIAMLDAEDSIEQVLSRYSTDLRSGLTSEAAEKKLKEDGLNELYKPPKPTLLMLFIMQLLGFIIILLIIAAVASMTVNATGSKKDDPLSYTTGACGDLFVILNAGIAAWTEHKAGDALEALSKMTQAAIYATEQEVQITTNTVVRGDIVVLGTGDVVPADMRLAEAEDLKVSEMALTGEPDDVSKTWKLKPRKEGEPEKLTPEVCVFSGCNVTNGKGRGVVTATGMGTRIGRIAQLIAGEEGPKKKCFCLPDTSANQTPLQRNLEQLGAKIGILAIVVCVLVFIIGVALDRKPVESRKDVDSQSGAESGAETGAALYMVLIAVTLAVAAIPEGIPLCVTISLSIGCSDMVNQHVLVRKLAAVETLGSASVICSDKTGTLTEGKMTMVNMWAGGVTYDVGGKGFDPTVGRITTCDTGVEAGRQMGVRSTLLSGILCCALEVEVRDPDTGEEKWEPRGNSSEAPIVVAARKVGLTENVSKDYPRTIEIPFSSSRKMMLTVSDVSGRSHLCEDGMPLPEGRRGTKYLAVCKARSLGRSGVVFSVNCRSSLRRESELFPQRPGAPNFIVDLCEERMMADGTVAKHLGRAKAEVLKVVDDYSTKALRVLAVAARPMKELPFDMHDDELSTDQKFSALRQDLRLLGLVASIDPDRDGVKDSVLAARGAGIRVVMITGDYLKTAIAIAKNVQILQPQDDEATAAVDCNCLRPGGQYLETKEMDRMTSTVRVFARAKPEDKLEIVKSIQRMGQVAAMTGDGVNDAPALNQANIGVAMGIQGTEVAKGASDMILTDDNFCSIVAAVEKGRAIYSGIQKFVAFIMSVHIAEVMQIFVCIAAGVPVMRTPLQILFLILVTDLPPSIALGMEPGEPGILKLPGRPGAGASCSGELSGDLPGNDPPGRLGK